VICAVTWGRASGYWKRRAGLGRGLVRERSSNDDVASSAAARGMVDLCEY
jgi:hypothetical protein